MEKVFKKNQKIIHLPRAKQTEDIVGLFNLVLSVKRKVKK